MPEAFKWDLNSNPQGRMQPNGKIGSGSTWGSHQEPGPGDFIVRHAGLGWRILAGIIDYLLPMSLGIPLKEGGMDLWMVFIIWNSILYQGKTGQSLGKKLLGMRLCYIKEDPYAYFDLYELPGRWRCGFRLFAHWLDMPFLYGLLIRPLFHWRHRTFADSVASTVVIRDTRVHIFTRAEAEAERELET